MQVEMAHIGTYIGGIGPTDLRIHVCTIHIDETTVLMHGGYHRADGLLEDTMRRRISDHTTGENLFVLFRFGLPVREVGVSLFIALDDARRETRLHTGGEKFFSNAVNSSCFRTQRFHQAFRKPRP